MHNSISTPNSLKKAVVFVHGFKSTGGKCWGPLKTLLEQDADIRNCFALETSDYRTTILNASINKKSPSLAMAGEALRNELVNGKFKEFSELHLFGHSQGGLVIQHFITDALDAKGGLELLERIRQVVLFATPNFGSDYARGIRRWIGPLIRMNPEEKSLRPFDEEIGNLQGKILRNVVCASYRGKKRYPVPVVAFAGTQDPYVPKASAGGHFVDVRVLKGNHSTLKEPVDLLDDRYITIKRLLLSPVGHLQVFDIDTYEIHVEVKYFEKGVEEVSHGTTRRTVQTDNETFLTRHITFSDNNNCENLFDIRYETRKDGFIDIVSTGGTDNETPLIQQPQYLDYGNTATFQFRPETKGPYEYSIRILDGFGKKNRKVHFHPGASGMCRIKKYRVVLDVRDYLKRGGYRFSKNPEFFYDPKDPVNHSECDKRILKNPIPSITSSSQGVFEWEIFDISSGVVDIKWDFLDDRSFS